MVRKGVWYLATWVLNCAHSTAITNPLANELD